MGVDDLRSSQGFCRLPPVAPFCPLGLLGIERGSEPLRPKSTGQSSDISVMFWNDALFLIGKSAATNVLLFDAFSSSFSSLRSISTVRARSLELLLSLFEFLSSCRGFEGLNAQLLFSIRGKVETFCLTLQQTFTETLSRFWTRQLDLFFSVFRRYVHRYLV